MRAWNTVCEAGDGPEAYTQAVEQIRRALEFNPDSRWFRRVLGLALHRSGHHREARRTLEELDRERRERGGESARRFLDAVALVLCCEALGEIDAARTWLMVAEKLAAEQMSGWGFDLLHEARRQMLEHRH